MISHSRAVFLSAEDMFDSRCTEKFLSSGPSEWPSFRAQNSATKNEIYCQGCFVEASIRYFWTAAARPYIVISWLAAQNGFVASDIYVSLRQKKTTMAMRLEEIHMLQGTQLVLCSLGF